MSKSRAARPELVRAVQERRRSGAAGKHDPRPRKLRTRSQQRNTSVNRSIAEG